jgi:hyperosmotically inducible protein
MKIGNTIKIGVSLACALFIGNAMANQSHALTVATVESTASKDMKETKEYLSDSTITGKVKEKFIQEKLLGKDKISAMGISVKTKKGVVTLSGKVPSKDQEATAVKLAKSVDGVKDVVSKIKVKSSKETKAQKAK